MKHIVALLLLVGVLTQSVSAVEVHDRYRTFTREILKSEYLNNWQDDTVTKINELVAVHPGDSTKAGTSAHDTLSANGDGQITAHDAIFSLSASDSLNFHRANIDRAHVDSLFIGPVSITPTFALISTAGYRAHFSYADIDSMAGNVIFSDGYVLNVGRAKVDTIATDSLTVIGSMSIANGATASVFTAGGTLNATGTFKIGGTAVTSTATELNIMDGVTSTTAELNILDGVTATFTELNLIDGYTGTTANLNTLTDDSMADALHRHSELSASDGTPNAALQLDASGDAVFSGAVSANGGFTGDGSGLTNVTAAGGLSAITYDQSIVKLDTTIASVGTGGGNGSKVIVGSLLNWDDNCVNAKVVNGSVDCSGSYEKWRKLEKTTSWYKADRADTTAQFPTNYAVTISTGQDSVVIWNRDTAELWMAFVGGGSNLLRINPPTSPINDFAFKDGIFYGAYEGYAFGTWDMLEEFKPTSYSTDGAHHLESVNIQTRNDGTQTWGGAYGASTLAIASASVNAVAVVRDPFGLTDALGRPKHWWIVGTAAKASIYNPHTDGIYDSNDVGIINNIVAGKVNWSYTADDGGVRDQMRLNRQPFSVTADAWSTSGTTYQNNGSGAQDFAWANAVVMSDIALVEGASINGTNFAKSIIGSDAGVYQMHPTGPADASSPSARQRFSSTVNAPVEFGDAVIDLALEDNTTDSSPYANTMTANGSPGTVDAVFGNGYSSTAGSSISHDNDSDFNTAAGNGGTFSLWLKTDDTSVEVNDTVIFLSLNGSAPYNYLAFEGGSGSGVLDYVVADGVTALQITSTSQIDDGKWHHVLATHDTWGANLYIDGVLSASSTTDATSATSMDDLEIGNHPSASRVFEGFIDDVVISEVSVGAEVAAKLYAEGRKSLAAKKLPGRPTDSIASADIDYVDALDNGIWLAGNEDSLTIFDGRIPLYTYGTSLGTLGTIADAALIQNPGADSVGVVMVTATEIILVQPDVSLEKMLLSNVYETPPVHVGETVVVDSAGVDGIFWTGDDAIDAGANAGVFDIKLGHGTIGPFDVDQKGMTVTGSGKYRSGAGSGTLVDGGTTDDAVEILASNVTISDMSIQTTAGGGTSFDAVRISSAGEYFIVRNVFIPESDAIGISLEGGGFNFGQMTGNVMHSIDGNCIELGGGYNRISDNTCYAGGGGILAYGTMDGGTITGNVIGNGRYITLQAGANNNAVTGNSTDNTGVSNSGTGNTVGDNSVF